MDAQPPDNIPTQPSPSCTFITKTLLHLKQFRPVQKPLKTIPFFSPNIQTQKIPVEW